MALLALAAVLPPGPARAEDPVATLQLVRPKPIKAAPDFQVRAPDDRQLRLSDFRGKVVFLNFWATWCEPCRDEFPMVNELAKKYAAQGLVVLGVSLDDDGEIELVRRFLARVQPVFPNYRKKPGYEEPFINAIDPKWTGAIPATFFYDPGGRQVAKLVGEHRREEFEAAIQKLLKQSDNSTAASR